MFTTRNKVYSHQKTVQSLNRCAGRCEPCLPLRACESKSLCGAVPCYGKVHYIPLRARGTNIPVDSVDVGAVTSVGDGMFVF